MKNIAPREKRDYLSRQLFFRVFGGYVLVTLLFACGHIAVEYVYGKRQLREELAAMETVFKPILAEAIFTLNYDQTDEILNGLIASPFLYRVRLFNAYGEKIGERRKDDGAGEHSSFLARPLSHTFHIDREEGKTEATRVGEAHFISDTTIILRKMQRSAIFIIGKAGAIALVFFVIFFIIMRRLLSLPLARLTRATKRIDLNTITGRAIDINTGGHNELKVLECAFNSMTAKIYNARQQMVAYSLELEEKNRQLTELDRLKDEFLANTSHELRTPLNGIVGITETLLCGAAGELSQIQKDNLLLVASSGRRLSGLVNDILDSAKMRRHNLVLDLSPLDISAVATPVISMLNPLAEVKSLALRNQIPNGLSAVTADEDRLQQILYNLLGNALKFTEKGTVTISAEENDGEISVRVADTGIGIPGDKLEKVFESFEQLDGSAERHHGGTGLGLAVTRQLVELHKGKIWAESEPGQGSRFIFTLPASDEAPRPSSGERIFGRPAATTISPVTAAIDSEIQPSFDSTPADGEATARILAVDDDATNLQVLKNMLKNHPFLVEIAISGKDALEKLAQNGHYDLILLDIMMPGLSGYDLCRNIRQNHSPVALPVIMLTAKNQLPDLLDGFSAGANDYLVKPFVREELLVRMNHHLALKSTTDELKKTLAEIEERVEERTRELTESNRQLIAAEKKALAAAKAKSDFLANVSHEIRTPMNRILASAELALGENNLAGKLPRHLKKIHSAGHDLLGMIDAILDYSKIGTGEFDLMIGAFDIEEVLEKVVSLSAKKASEKNIQLWIDIEPDTPMSVTGDETRLRQVLANLLDNALKFTPKGGVVNLGLCRTDDSAGIDADLATLRFMVRDTGIGIESEHLERLFDPFTQADTSSTRKFGGMGLGLAICRQLAETMGGKIWAESRPNAGTSFYFTIQAGKHVRQDKPILKAPAGIAGTRVLVADDCDTSRGILEKILSSFGFETDAVSFEETSARLGADRQYDLLVLDWAMPETKVIETARRIREELPTTVPILGLTAFDPARDKAVGPKAGIDKWLAKPVLPFLLLNTILGLLETKDKTDQPEPDDLPDPPPEAKPAHDPDEIISTLKTLGDQVENFDSSARKTCSALVDQLQNSALERKASDLGKALESYDFDEASALLAEIMANFNNEGVGEQSE